MAVCFAGLAAAILAAQSAVPAAPVGVDPVTQRERGAAVIVWSHVGPHQDAIGAGTIVGIEGRRLRIVTARHVVSYGAVTVWRDRHLYAGEVVRTFPNRDVAIVDVVLPPKESLPVPATPLAAGALSAHVRNGEPVSIWGEDDTGPVMVTAALFTTRMPAFDDPDAHDLIGLDCLSCKDGDSGGGVYNSAGDLIAVFSGRYHTRNGRTIASVAEPVDASMLAFGEETLSGPP